MKAARLVATCTASICHCAGRCLLLAIGLIDHCVGRRRSDAGSTVEATGTAGTGPAAAMSMTWFAYAYYLPTMTPTMTRVCHRQNQYLLDSCSHCTRRVLGQDLQDLIDSLTARAGGADWLVVNGVVNLGISTPWRSRGFFVADFFVESCPSGFFLQKSLVPGTCNVQRRKRLAHVPVTSFCFWRPCFSSDSGDIIQVV